MYKISNVYSHLFNAEPKHFYFVCLSASRAGWAKICTNYVYCRIHLSYELNNVLWKKSSIYILKNY